MMVDFGDIHEIDSLVFILIWTWCFVEVYCSHGTDGGQDRVLHFHQSFQINNDLLAINSCFTAVPWPFRWLIMLNYDMPHADEFDFDGQTTVFIFRPFRWLRVFRVLFASYRKLSFWWLMNHRHVRPSHWNFLSKRTCVTSFRWFTVFPDLIV